jgi:uncharacterized spore protein YtfJ
MANNVVDILKSVVGELREIARSETVIGQPITVGKTTVLPVIKLSVGFGAGGAQGEDTKATSRFGGGGGGGARIEPAGFIIIEENGVRFLATGKGKWDSIIEAVPGIAQKIADWKDKVKSEKDEKETGESDKKHGDNGDNDE